MDNSSIIDEVAYCLRRRSVNPFFQLLSSRYEGISVIGTSNMPFRAAR